MGRRKIEIKRLLDKRTRNTTFNKRKYGLFKKAYELEVLTGYRINVLITDENAVAKYSYSSDLTRSNLNYSKIPLANRVGPDFFKKVKETTRKKKAKSTDVKISENLATLTPQTILSTEQIVTGRNKSPYTTEVPNIGTALMYIETPSDNIHQDLILYNGDTNFLDNMPMASGLNFDEDNNWLSIIPKDSDTTFAKDYTCLDIIPKAFGFEISEGEDTSWLDIVPAAPDFNFQAVESNSKSLIQPVMGSIQPNIIIPNNHHLGIYSFSENVPTTLDNIFSDVFDTSPIVEAPWQ